MRNDGIRPRRLPEWLRKPAGPSGSAHAMKAALRGRSLHTVCEEARCPNIGECFGRGTATIMIMGDICTRACGFCAVAHGLPGKLDPDEPGRVAGQVRELGLRHAVITSVTRDDLSDGGAAHFAAAISAIRAGCPATSIEVLTPDFEGREGDIEIVCAAGPDVFNHNVETVERLTPMVRNKASYRRSLDVLTKAKNCMVSSRGAEGDVAIPRNQGDCFGASAPRNDTRYIKSGLMVGLGETRDEIDSALRDLAGVGCDIVTIGQYLQPTKKALPVAEYIEPKVFLEYEEMGLSLGIKAVFSGPFVRSSYMADKVILNPPPL
ncbi:MAG: lipoyl synthase [bacterium]